jgi:hypothetical protein
MVLFHCTKDVPCSVACRQSVKSENASHLRVKRLKHKVAVWQFSEESGAQLLCAKQQTASK